MRKEKLGRSDEKELLYKSLRGEKEAWGEIVKRYKEAVYGVNLSILKDEAEAEDATQKTFIKAWKNLEKYDMDRKFSTWLFTVGSNISKNIVRKQNRWSFIEKMSLVSENDDPQDKIEKEKRRKGIREALFDLEPKYRAPLIMRFWGELSYDEISEILDVPQGTIKTRLHRGKKKLKAVYQEVGLNE